MINSRLSFLSILSAIFLIGCTRVDEPLLGSWDCVGEPQITDVAGKAKLTLILNDADAFEYETFIEGTQNNVHQKLHGVSSGEWNYANSILKLNHTKAEVISATMDGEIIDASQLRSIEKHIASQDESYTVDIAPGSIAVLTNHNSTFQCVRTD